MTLINEAFEIAKHDLRACYGNEGIYAGLTHFHDYWARDSFFSSLGALAIKDNIIVRKNLDMFLSNLNKKGQVPLRVGRTPFNLFLSFFGWRKFKRKGLYNIDKSDHKSVDQNSLFIISAYNYIKKSRDLSVFERNTQKFEKIMAWNFLRDFNNDLLIEERPYCNWADSVKKNGAVLYTNVCHAHAIDCLANLFSLVDKQKEKYYRDLFKKVKKTINDKFWSGEHYIDWIDGEQIYNYFSSDGNFLAILWDIADKEKANHIEEASHIYDINDVPSQCVHPYYPKKLISEINRLGNMVEYHNGQSWLWLGCINALAKHKLGKHKEAKEILKKIAKIIVKHGRVYEVYEKTGNPVKKLLYRAENPFAWSSGLYLYAVNEIMKI